MYSTVEGLENEFPQIRKYVLNPDIFQRVLKLAYLQGIQKETEHHLQVRGQWTIWNKLLLLLFGERLVKTGALTRLEDIFEVSIEQLFLLVEASEENKLTHRTIPENPYILF